MFLENKTFWISIHKSFIECGSVQFANSKRNTYTLVFKWDVWVIYGDFGIVRISSKVDRCFRPLEPKYHNLDKKMNYTGALVKFCFKDDTG